MRGLLYMTRNYQQVQELLPQVKEMLTTEMTQSAVRKGLD